MIKNMEILELKHIVNYLPFGLNVKSKKHFCKYGEETILKLNGLAFQGNDKDKFWQYEFVHEGDLKFADINEKGFKLMLRPLSDLKNNIEGEEISYIEYISTSKSDYQRTMRLVSNGQNLDVLEYWKMNILFEYHFDVFGLIEKGLAIDKNEIK